MIREVDILILGGGAAGFFTAINIAARNPKLRMVILERGAEVLTKVRVSGGGRCNVTHAEFIPKELTTNYPRGEKELLGPFHTFMTGDTMQWFEERGVPLKIEADGRVFPVSDDSQTIIDCFLSECKKLEIPILTNHPVKQVRKEGNSYTVFTTKGNFISEKIVIATGSNPKMWKILEALGHTIVPPVPSLFTFHCKDERISDLPGVSTNASIKVLGTALESGGPILITHWGLSGPAILKLSAWGAWELNALDYKFTLQVNWLENMEAEEVISLLKGYKQDQAKQLVAKYPLFELPKRLWQSLVNASGIDTETKWAEVNKQQLLNLTTQLTESKFEVDGKSIFKEEFVTAGGIDLKEVNFKTFESKLHKELYFAGEILNIDAVTGGFNFQNAWTGAYLAAMAITEDK